MPKKHLERLEPPARPRYFSGRLLSARDLAEEQDYHLEKHRRHNRFLHGSGIVFGLKVSLNGGDGGAVHVEPGLALDCLGREIHSPETVKAPLPKPAAEICLGLRYAERLIDPVPVPKGGVEASRIQEGFEIVWRRTAELSCSRRLPQGQRACGKDHPVPIARLRHTRGRWRLDLRFRPPRIR